MRRNGAAPQFPIAWAMAPGFAPRTAPGGPLQGLAAGGEGCIAVAMTDPTDAELAARYRARLMAEAAALKDSTAETAADRRPVELDQQSVGRLSRQDALQMQAMAKAQDVRRAARGRAIAAALARIDKADFGWCEDCGDFIGQARLDLDPCVTRCIDCAR